MRHAYINSLTGMARSQEPQEPHQHSSRNMANDDALWAKLSELELQLAAYHLVRAARGADVCADADAGSMWGSATCRGRRYEAYMRRRDARRTAGRAVAAAEAATEGPERVRPRALAGTLNRSGSRCSTTSQDMQEVKRLAESVPTPSTLQKENRATPRPASGTLPRSRTMNAVTARAPKLHQRRNSLAGPIDVARTASHKPFLKRGSGTGAGAGAGAAGAVTKLRAPPKAPFPDLPASEVSSPAQERARPGHVRSVSVSDFAFEPALDSPKSEELTTQASAGGSSVRARKRWGSPEKPAMFSGGGADSPKDFAKGLKKLLSFARKNKGEQSSGACTDSGKPEKGWSGACSFDASLESHQSGMSAQSNWFQTAQAIGISG